MPTSGLPTARHLFPPGTSGPTCIAYNRSCKVARIVAKALELGYDNTLTDEQIDACADSADVRRPGDDGQTYAAVRKGLLEPLTDDDAAQSFAEAAMDAAAGIPFRYTDHQGRTVLLVPLPVGE
ncbi:hypothetical protein ABZ404_37085 [Streptomyces sp. NPDC005878]|uniref:hypothetical protein n=1 Tax=Streptomyces sp. NPDC005878 TaxID=3157077 RepID=UPI0033D91D20